MLGVMRSALGRPGLLLSLVALLATGPAATAQSLEAALRPVADDSPSPVHVSHPAGSTDVLLRMDTHGGLVPLTFSRAQAPEFTLYGDGTVLFRGLDDPEGDGFPPFIQARMAPAQMDALLLVALDAGGLRHARESYDHRQATDQPTTIFAIDADGSTKSVAVYGLGTAPTEGPDAAAYERFEDLAVQLVTFWEQADSGLYQDAQPYRPAGYRAFLSPTEDPSIDAVPWPWPDLTLADFEAYGYQEDVRIGGLTPIQARAVTTEPSGGVPALIVVGPDDIPYTLTIRPLLPGEPVDPTARLARPSPGT
jgi:hypothetical protein